jgi:hypothetical protein
VEKPDTLEISAADLDDFDMLYAELRGVSGIAVEAVPAPVSPGDQGGLVELLSVALSGGAVAKLLEIVQTLLDSRGPGFKLTMRRGKERLEISADNAEEVLPLLRELLRGP